MKKPALLRSTEATSLSFECYQEFPKSEIGFPRWDLRYEEAKQPA